MDTILLETFPYSQKQKSAFRKLSAFIQQALVSEEFEHTVRFDKVVEYD